MGWIVGQIRAGILDLVQASFRLER